MNLKELQRLKELQDEQEQVLSVMPQAHFQMNQRNKYLFFLAREIEILENPDSYKHNKEHWEGHEMTM